MPDNLSDVMQSATENLHPNIGKLTAGGIERGVRKRRNRRLAQIAGAATSVTAVFGVVAMVGLPGSGDSAGVSAASTTPAVAAHTNPALNAKTEAAPGSNSGKPTAAPVTGDQMVDWLKQTLNPYHLTGEETLYKGGSEGEGDPFATLRIGYNGQAGSVSLTVSRAAYQEQQLPPYTSEKTLADGSQLEIFNGPEWPAGNGDPSAKRIEVSLYRTDGTEIDLQVLNEVQEKGATTATDLGLSVQQAANVVQSPLWDKASAAVLAKPVPAAPSIPSGDKTKLEQAKKAGSGS